MSNDKFSVQLEQLKKQEKSNDDKLTLFLIEVLDCTIEQAQQLVCFLKTSQTIANDTRNVYQEIDMDALLSLFKDMKSEMKTEMSEIKTEVKKSADVHKLEKKLLWFAFAVIITLIATTPKGIELAQKVFGFLNP